MTQTLKDTQDTSPNATYANGPGGLLNTPGLGAKKRKPRITNAALQTAKEITALVVTSKASGWDESKHPRGEAGKFGEGSGGQSNAEKIAANDKRLTAMRAERDRLNERAGKLKKLRKSGAGRTFGAKPDFADRVKELTEQAITLKRGGTSGRDEQNAMYANIRKAGDYDDSEVGSGGKAQTSDRPRRSSKKPASRSAKRTPARASSGGSSSRSVRRSGGGGRLDFDLFGRLREASDAFLGKEANAFVVFKQGDVYRWLATSSNAYRDNDGEYVSLKAQQNDTSRMFATGNFGPLRYWHLGDLERGVDIGTCDYSAMYGPLRVESGTFKDADIARACMVHQKELALSLGFTHPMTEPDASGVYHTINTFERSILPRTKAANPYTAFAVQKESNSMTDVNTKWKEFVTLCGGDEAKANTFLAELDTMRKEIDAAGVTHKEQDAPIAAEAVTLKRGGESGPAERDAMFANLHKSGEYDETEVGGGGKSQSSDRPRGSSRRPNGTHARRKKESELDEITEKAFGAKPMEQPEGEKPEDMPEGEVEGEEEEPVAEEMKADGEGVWGEGEAAAGSAEADAGGVDISSMTIGELQQALAQMLAGMILSTTKELNERIEKLETAQTTRTKEADDTTKRLKELNKRVKELEGDAPPVRLPGYRASTDGPAPSSATTKENTPYVDPLVTGMLASFAGN